MWIFIYVGRLHVEYWQWRQLLYFVYVTVCNCKCMGKPVRLITRANTKYPSVIATTRDHGVHHAISIDGGHGRDGVCVCVWCRVWYHTITIPDFFLLSCPLSTIHRSRVVLFQQGALFRSLLCLVRSFSFSRIDERNTIIEKCRRFLPHWILRQWKSTLLPSGRKKKPFTRKIN